VRHHLLPKIVMNPCAAPPQKKDRRRSTHTSLSDLKDGPGCSASATATRLPFVKRFGANQTILTRFSTFIECF
jgi:hypothetical protein